MKKYFIAPMQGSWAVVCRNENLGLCAVSDHLLEESAQREAERLNAQHAAERARRYERPFVRRQPVRYFEPDAFA